ncbi:ATP-binding protein [Sphingobium sufflavum]|uniref:ATP-binding protein n=1 Tax=Sphingobium sufflavum TaxID=1129547 RepID=UPI001F33F4D8|nr:ATP-binding protein [Sphingobium sufflavum]MCE7796378.1 ATP-binding protein [Sphingobium sufflavum]
MMPDAAPPLVAQAKRFAALSAIFDPVDAVPEAARESAELASVVASALAVASDTNPRQGTGWLIRMAERRYILDDLYAHGALDAAIAERRALAMDQPAHDLLDALSARAPFEAEGVRAAIEHPDTPQEMIERIVTALDRAGPIAAAHPHIVAARLRLAQFGDSARWAAVRARGFVGRARETAELRDWLQSPVTAPPSRAALLTGCPGIGKSALLDAMTQVAVADYGALVIRLDFDRAGLDVLDQTGLTMEVARQLVDRIGDAATSLLDARLEAAKSEGGPSGTTRSLRSDLPGALADSIGMAVAKANRPVLLILDTMEVLRARGETHPAMLFDWIDRLVTRGLQPLWIMAAGRGDVLDRIPDRRGPHIPLEGLDGAAAASLLKDSGLTEAAQAAVLAIAGGNPLVLRLAAKVVAAHGTAALPQAQLTGDVTAGFLYRFLLSRINDPDLRRLAHPGMIARRLSADFLREVLAPELGLAGMSEARAEALFAILASEHWLVERDPGDPAFVRHRGDMRALLLPMLYADQPVQCARIDAAAVRWFGRRGDDASQFDAAYHRLQLLRRRPARPMIGADIARRFDPATITELPPQAQKLVAQAAGRRSEHFRGGDTAGAAPSASDADATHELLRLIEANDWVEGAFVVDQIEQAGGIDPRSLQADAIRTYHWRAGRWSTVRRLLAERDQFSEAEGDLTALPPQIALARLEMRAEFMPERLTADWLRMALSHVGGAPQSLTDMPARMGALGVRLTAAGLLARQPWSRAGDPVAAALALWSGDAQDAVVDSTFGVARDRLRARGASAEMAGWNNPQLLAALTPYAAVALNLSRRPDRQELAAIAHLADSRLSEAGALLDNRPLLALASDPVTGIGELGLFAEWAGAAAWLTGDRDLAEIGRAAERWRRTVAGQWSYAGRPATWREAGPLDAVLTRRIEALLGEYDPPGAAMAQLGLWSAEGGEAIWTRIERRFATSLRAAAQVADTRARAALLARRMPAAFVPAATILTLSQAGDAS